MDPVVLWIAAGLVLLVAEVMAPGVYLMWLGLAAIGTGLVLMATGWGLGALSVVFAVFALSGVAVALWLRRRQPRQKVNTGDAGLLGRRAHALAFEGREGRVRVGDSDWPARMVPGAAAPAQGDVLEVAAVDGMTLVVRPPREVAKA
jgi:membrane protein implicated in regulation of membrane protease activity